MSKLILIDDDIIYHKIVQLMLKVRHPNDETTFSYDGRAIIEFLDQNKAKNELLPDCILVDLNMPVFDGWDFLNSYQKIYKFIKKKIDIYVVSSSINPREIARTKKYPFVHSYIIKPLTMELIDKIVH
ncbi:MAG: response regulator [Mucilaginibacter sp.]